MDPQEVLATLPLDLREAFVDGDEVKMKAALADLPAADKKYHWARICQSGLWTPGKVWSKPLKKVSLIEAEAAARKKVKEAADAEARKVLAAQLRQSEPSQADEPTVIETPPTPGPPPPKATAAALPQDEPCEPPTNPYTAFENGGDRDFTSPKTSEPMESVAAKPTTRSALELRSFGLGILLGAVLTLLAGMLVLPEQQAPPSPTCHWKGLRGCTLRTIE